MPAICEGSNNDSPKLPSLHQMTGDRPRVQRATAKWLARMFPRPTQDLFGINRHRRHNSFRATYLRYLWKAPCSDKGRSWLVVQRHVAERERENEALSFPWSSSTHEVSAMEGSKHVGSAAALHWLPQVPKRHISITIDTSGTMVCNCVKCDKTD
jgi:hypothetical protein